VCYIFTLHYTPLPPIPAPAKASPLTLPALGTPQLLASLDSLRLDHMILLDNVSGGSGYVHRIVDLLNTPELIEISSDDKKLEDQLEGDPKEEQEKEEVKGKHPQEDPMEYLGWRSQMLSKALRMLDQSCLWMAQAKIPTHVRCLRTS